jgi:hypothetical protein
MDEPLPPRPVPQQLTDGAEGYVELERSERWAMHRAIAENQGLVEHWCRLLTLYREAMSGTREFDGPDAERHSWLVRQLMAAVVCGTSKMALDAALAGRYTQGFALCRHMLETWVQMVYVGFRPDQALRWSSGPNGEPPIEPSYGTLKRTVLCRTGNPGLFHVIDRLITQYNKGAHPSGLALGQVIGSTAGFIRLGATYQWQTCIRALDHGSFATLMVLGEITNTLPQNEGWHARLRATALRRRAWLEAYVAENGDDIGFELTNAVDAPPPPDA